MGSVDPELLDQGKQTELACVLKRCGPPNSRLTSPRMRPSDESVVKMRDGGDVPGVTGQGTCEETFRVVDEVGDDHFDNFERKIDDGGRARGRSL